MQDDVIITHFSRMLQRHGDNYDFERLINTILPNEFISVTSGYPYSKDGTALYFKPGDRKIKRVLTEDDIKNTNISYFRVVCAKLLPQLFGGTCKVVLHEFLVGSSFNYLEIPSSEYNPATQKLIVWCDGIPLVQNVDYYVIPSDEKYLLHSITEIPINTDIYVEVWQLPTMQGSSGTAISDVMSILDGSISKHDIGVLEKQDYN